MTHLHDPSCRGLLILTTAFLFASEPPVFAGERADKSSASIELTLVDDQAIAYATFQSHNQKVVSNQHGLFITYIRKSNADYTAQQWRLARSTDDSRSFATVLEETRATSAPALETDKRGTLFFARPDFKDGNAYLSRLESLSDKPSVTQLVGGSAGKYCLSLDEPRKQLYYFAHNGTCHVVGGDGKMISQRTKDALQATKRRGVKLGSARPDHWEGREDRRQAGAIAGGQAAGEAHRRAADESYGDLYPVIKGLRGKGQSLQAIADDLNDQGHTTRRGKPWNPMQVSRVLKRAA